MKAFIFERNGEPAALERAKKVARTDRRGDRYARRFRDPARLAGAFGKDPPAPLIEDAIAIVGACAIVAAFA